MGKAYDLRRRNEAILDIARAMQLPLDELPEVPPRRRIGIKQRGLILRPGGEGASRARQPEDPANPRQACQAAPFPPAFRACQRPSWLDLVACWFALLSRRRRERGALTCTGDL